jgi:hypothetical protein
MKHPITGLLLLDESPESGGACPHCGNVAFTGICLDMSASQGFDSPETPEHSPDYQSYDSEIGEYQYVTCADCELLVWYDPKYFLLPAVVTAMQVHLAKAFGDAENTIAWDALTARSLAQLDYHLPEAVAERQHRFEEHMAGVRDIMARNVERAEELQAPPEGQS